MRESIEVHGMNLHGKSTFEAWRKHWLLMVLG